MLLKLKFQLHKNYSCYLYFVYSVICFENASQDFQQQQYVFPK